MWRERVDLDRAPVPLTARGQLWRPLDDAISIAEHVQPDLGGLAGPDNPVDEAFTNIAVVECKRVRSGTEDHRTPEADRLRISALRRQIGTDDRDRHLLLRLPARRADDRGRSSPQREAADRLLVLR